MFIINPDIYVETSWVFPYVSILMLNYHSVVVEMQAYTITEPHPYKTSVFYRIVDHPCIYQPENIPQSRVSKYRGVTTGKDYLHICQSYICWTVFLLEHSYFRTYFFLSISCLFSVIVTEKTNILLRYLHQQWDKKVKVLKEVGVYS